MVGIQFRFLFPVETISSNYETNMDFSIVCLAPEDSIALHYVPRLDIRKRIAIKKYQCRVRSIKKLFALLTYLYLLERFQNWYSRQTLTSSNQQPSAISQRTFQYWISPRRQPENINNKKKTELVLKSTRTIWKSSKSTFRKLTPSAMKYKIRKNAVVLGWSMDSIECSHVHTSQEHQQELG